MWEGKRDSVHCVVYKKVKNSECVKLCHKKLILSLAVKHAKTFSEERKTPNLVQ